ncbi:MAG: LysM peptidoglycan-binding domain-containing protein [Chloroflexota bacterium]
MTHDKARKLIQLNADEALSGQEMSRLSAHLGECLECRTYAEEIKEVESILAPLMKRQWSLQSIPSPVAILPARKNIKAWMGTLLTTRKVAVGVVLLTFVFSAWQFALSDRQGSNPLPIGVLPVPTPSTQSTSTLSTSQSCEEMHYVVRADDTLEDIAQQFAVSKEEIAALNHMKTETMHAGMELILPVCSFTPASTIHPTTLSTRYTPSTRPITSTPGG